jgi:6-phospho-3-hexuloisomerase
MKETKRAMREILDHLENSLKKLNGKQVEKFIDTLLTAKRVFVVGAGRSGLVVKAFAMRLMHLGINVYVVGETITPALYKGDVVIAVSGSGETDLIVESAKISKKIGAKLIAITSRSNSSLAKLADLIVTLPGRGGIPPSSKFMGRQLTGEHAPLAPLGTLFEITALTFLDSVIASLMVRLGRGEEELRVRHAIIE